MAVIPSSQYGEFINDAVRDLTMHGWLNPIDEDVSLTMAASTYTYSIPASWAYIRRIYEESDTSPSTYDIVLPKHQYRLGMLATATPSLILDGDLWYPRSGKKFKLVGQKRPSTYSSDSETIEPLFEGFLRERASAYALYFLAAMPMPGAADYAREVENDSPTTRRPPDRPGFATERARNLAALANLKYANSERSLTFHPNECRVKPDSEHVPGR
jgi:hypothetical protein